MICRYAQPVHIQCWAVRGANQLLNPSTSHWSTETIHICSSCGIAHCCISLVSNLVPILCWSSRKQSESHQGDGFSSRWGSSNQRQLHCTWKPCAFDKLWDTNIPMSLIMCWICRVGQQLNRQPHNDPQFTSSRGIWSSLLCALYTKTLCFQHQTVSTCTF